MPDWHGTTGRDDLVGGVCVHLEGGGCNHRQGNVCPVCAELTEAETAALREYFALLKAKNATPSTPRRKG